MSDCFYRVEIYPAKGWSSEDVVWRDAVKELDDWRKSLAQAREKHGDMWASVRVTSYDWKQQWDFWTNSCTKFQEETEP